MSLGRLDGDEVLLLLMVVIVFVVFVVDDGGGEGASCAGLERFVIRVDTFNVVGVCEKGYFTRRRHAVRFVEALHNIMHLFTMPQAGGWKAVHRPAGRSKNPE